jgi:hypothetical protein
VNAGRVSSEERARSLLTGVLNSNTGVPSKIFNPKRAWGATAENYWRYIPM